MKSKVPGDVVALEVRRRGLNMFKQEHFPLQCLEQKLFVLDFTSVTTHKKLLVCSFPLLLRWDRVSHEEVVLVMTASSYGIYSLLVMNRYSSYLYILVIRYSDYYSNYLSSYQ